MNAGAGLLQRFAHRGPARRSIRLRLTLVYGGLFVVCGAVLLTITYLLVIHTEAPVAFTVKGAAAVGKGVPLPKNLFVSSGSLPDPTPDAFAYALGQLALQRSAEHRQLLLQSGVALGIMAVVSMGLGWLVAGRVLRPIRTITATAQEISASNLHRRLELGGPDDEVRELGDTFDALLARLEQAFEAQRQFVANASHELRTPLTLERALLESALGDPGMTVTSWQHTAERVLAAEGAQERLIEALLTLARGDRGPAHWEPLDLGEVTARVAAAPDGGQGAPSPDGGHGAPEPDGGHGATEPDGGHGATEPAAAAPSGVALSVDLQPAPMVGDPRLVERLVDNLVQNAWAHNVAGGEVHLRTGRSEGWALLEVANTGPEVAVADLPRLFQPFQSLDGSRQAGANGLGLGLSIVRSIADAHGARLEAALRPGGGLVVTVSFPPAAR